MRRPPLPAVLSDLGREPTALRTLEGACLALLAAGLAPRVLSAGLPSVQAAVRERPGIEVVLLVASVLTAGMLLVGGALGDADGRKRIMHWALVGLALTSLDGLVIADGPLFLISRFIGIACASIVLPLALAGVATRYQGVPRATAIGIAYAAYGAATAAGPVLLTLFGPSGSRWPAFLAAVLAATAALRFSLRSWDDLPAASRTQRSAVVATATWAFGIVVVTAALIGLQGSDTGLIRLAFGIAGACFLATGLVMEERRRRTDRTPLHVERRLVATALFVGFVIAYTQSAALLQVPLYFQLILGYGPTLAVVATIPFMIALVAAGPVAGALLGRVQPRALVVMGILAVGLGSVIIGAILHPGAGYIGFAVSFLLIGAGFVIATTVRTAIIFASVPRGLPATAAALNEASVSLGSRAGLVAVTLLITTLALDSYAASLVGRPPGDVSAAVDAFRTLLVAIGLPTFGGLVEGIGAADTAAYAAAYTDAVRTVMLSTGVVTLVAAPIAWFAIGRRDPLRTVWEHRDERGGASPGASIID